MSVQELCLVPKTVLESILASKEATLLKKDKVTSPFINNIQNKPNLESELKNLFTTKIKLDNALNLYNWVYANVKDLTLTNNGNVISPLANFNLIEFIKDVISNTKNVSKDKLNLYKVWVAIIDLPIDFIKNDFIKNYIFPNHHFESSDSTSPNPNKRKLTFDNPINSPKREKVDNKIPLAVKTRQQTKEGSGKKIRWISY